MRTIIEPFRIKVVEAILALWSRRDSVGGYRFSYQTPVLRHFSAEFEPQYEVN